VIYNRVPQGVCSTPASIGNFCEADRWYSLRYDRRTYGISLNYSPVQQTGFLQLRVDDFNWGTAGSITRNTPQVQMGVTTR
jgi:hypothetical protein